MTGAIELAVVLAMILLPLVAAVARHPKREEIRRRRDPRRPRERQWTPTPGGPEPRLRQVARAARSYRRASRWF